MAAGFRFLVITKVHNWKLSLIGVKARRPSFTEFKSGGLSGSRAVATWNCICFQKQENEEWAWCVLKGGRQFVAFPWLFCLFKTEMYLNYIEVFSSYRAVKRCVSTAAEQVLLRPGRPITLATRTRYYVRTLKYLKYFLIFLIFGK